MGSAARDGGDPHRTVYQIKRHMDDPDYFVAGASEMGEDEHGWWVKGEFDLENPKARQK